MTNLPPSLDRFRFQLERAVAADLRRRRRRRAVGLAAAVCAVLVVVNLLPSGGDRPGGVAPASAVERAAQVLQPRKGEILHMHIVGRQFEDGRPDVRWEHESWTLVGTAENRTVQTPPSGPVAETEKLLSIAAQHPGAPVVRDGGAFDQVLRELFPNG